MGKMNMGKPSGGIEMPKTTGNKRKPVSGKPASEKKAGLGMGGYSVKNKARMTGRGK